MEGGWQRMGRKKVVQESEETQAECFNQPNHLDAPAI